MADGMVQIDVKLPSGAYPVYLGRGLLDESALWRRHLGGGKALIVSNEIVAPLYLGPLKDALRDHDVDVHVIPDGEALKTVETWHGVIDKLIAMQARRDANIIALGGGVVGDIAGFAAASYMRGIRYIQAPTTLLAQVDASVGGKTGINHEKGKNLIGAFHQPSAVVIDLETLSTLPGREFNAGMAEVVKYGAIRDLPLIEWLEEHVDAVLRRENGALKDLIGRSVRNKTDIVIADEREAGVRALLNFGHSFGHALEAWSAYSRFLHGEAVAIGMVIAATLSESRGLCDPGTSDRLSALLQQFELPVRLPASTPADALIEVLQLDKKAVAGGLRLVLLKSLGEAVIDNQSRYHEIAAAIRHCRSDASTSTSGREDKWN